MHRIVTIFALLLPVSCQFPCLWATEGPQQSRRTCGCCSPEPERSQPDRSELEASCFCSAVVLDHGVYCLEGSANFSGDAAIQTTAEVDFDLLSNQPILVAEMPTPTISG